MYFFSLILILYFSCTSVYIFVHASMMFGHQYLEDIFIQMQDHTEWNIGKKGNINGFFFSLL